MRVKEKQGGQQNNKFLVHEEFKIKLIFKIFKKDFIDYNEIIK